MRPVPSLATTTEAARAFERVRAAWARNDPGDRPQLRRSLEDFAVAFPDDGLAPLARLYDVLSLMDSPSDWATAARKLEALPPPPPGSAHDLYVVATAKLRRYRHQPEAAFELLRPIVGNVVDPRARALLQEELTFDALEARQPYEAIAYMDAWLRGASEDDRAASEAKVAVALGAVPEAALRGSLEAMRASARAGQSHGYGAAIERLVGERLGQIAVERGDATLARWLLDAEAGAPPLGDESSAALSRLATSRRGIGSVVGRTVGLVLPTSSPDLRDEAADVLRGVLFALGLGQDDPQGGGPSPLAIRLVTRDDGGDPARLKAGMEEVLGEGASVIITALDDSSSAQALAWAEAAKVDVIVLASPDAPGPRPANGFNVGEDWRTELATLGTALSPPRPPRASDGLGGRAPSPPRIATIADTEALASLGAVASPPGSPWQAPVSCDVEATRAGESRFPVAAWDRAGVDRWLVAGSPSCASDLLQGLGARPRRGVVGLSLEASTAERHVIAGLRVVRAAAGVVPLGAARADDPRVAAVKAMVKKTGAPEGWWAALGRDAAALAGSALAGLPADTTADVDGIARRRALVHQGLVAAHVPLWTSDSDGFDAARDVQRSIRLVELDR